MQTGYEFPAQAGMNRLESVSVVVSKRVPRASGDEPSQQGKSFVDSLSSPRKRG